MRSSKIVKKAGYIGHRNQIIEVGDEQVIVVTESYHDTFNTTSQKRAKKKHDTTVAINIIKKYKPIAKFSAKLDPIGVDQTRKVRSKYKTLL